jgi:two-component system, OmpR family, phosphate regulon sensor histidine kinase PhoR
MIFANKTHIVLLFLYGLIVVLAIWGLVSQTGYSHLPIAIWASIGAVGACGAMLEILAHIRTKTALRQMKDQIQKMSKIAEVGLVMLDEQWPVEGLAGMLNEYLTLIRKKMNGLARERKELGLLVQAVDAEKHNTEAVVRSISDAVVVVNSYGELTLANRRAEELFGFDLAARKGCGAEEVISDPKLLELLDPGRWKDPEPFRFEYELKQSARPGSDFFVITVSPVFIRNDELWALTLTLHDVTQERQLAQLKNDFVNHVSHELRTPLSSIKAYVELLLDGDIQTTSGRNEFYQIIELEVERLDRFIGNMLNLSRIESGLMAVEFSRRNLNEELRQAIQLVQYIAREKSIELEHVPPSEEMWVWADGDLLRQMILNLLSNAIKYTPPDGRVHLRAGLSGDRETYWICVQDTGIGFEAEEREKIFDKYYRSYNGKELSGGTGLGLALVKKVVEQIHGGRIEVESTPGQGSKFMVCLPVKPRLFQTDVEVEQEAVVV